MFSWAQSTISRYKRGLAMTAATGAGLAGLAYWVNNKLESWQHDQMVQLLSRSRTDNHMLHFPQNIRDTLTRYFEVLHRKIEQAVDTDRTVRSLKERTLPKVEGFEQLRLEALTKLLLAIHSSALLSLFTAVQLTVVAASPTATESATREYLGQVGAVLEAAVRTLAAQCEVAVRRVVETGAAPLDRPFAHSDLVVLVEECEVEVGRVEVGRICAGVRVTGAGEAAAPLQRMILLTLDIVESADFKNIYTTIVRDCIDRVNSQLFETFQYEQLPLVKALSRISKLPATLLSSETFVEACIGSEIQTFSCNLFQSISTLHS